MERAAPAVTGSGSGIAPHGGDEHSKSRPTENTAQAVVIGKVRKNARESIRVALDEYRGHRYVDVRVFVPGDGDEEKPTKAGVTLRLDAIPELAKLLGLAHDEARARGLL